MRRADSFEKTLMLGKIEGRRRRGRQKMRWLDGITDSMEMSLSDGQGSLACCGPWGHEESDMTERLNWTELIAALAQIRSMFTTIPRVFFASLVSMQMYLLLVYLNFFFFATWHVRSLFPNHGLRPPGMEAQSPNHWIARKFPISALIGRSLVTNKAEFLMEFGFPFL